MNEFYRVGQKPRVFATLLVAGAPTNATVLRLVITDPSGGETEYLYGQDPEIVHPSVGQYYFDLFLNAPGVWEYEWFSDTNNVAFKSGSIDVARPLTITTTNTEDSSAVPFVTVNVWDTDGALLDMGGTRTNGTGQLVSSLPPGSYRVLGTKAGWAYEGARVVDLTGEGPFAITLTGRLLRTSWLQMEDLESALTKSSIDQLFNDNNSGVRDAVLMESVIQQAESLAESKLLRNWSASQIPTLARADAAIRLNAAWIAIELVTERRPEFTAPDGKGRYWAQYERALDFFNDLAKSKDRSRGEASAGTGANVGGNVVPYVPPDVDPFIFAPGRGGRGPGGF